MPTVTGVTEHGELGWGGFFGRGGVYGGLWVMPTVMVKKHEGGWGQDEWGGSGLCQESRGTSEGGLEGHASSLRIDGA